MSNLREKFDKNVRHDENGIDSEVCEQITDDFAVKFAEWINIDAYKYPTKTTTTELLQIFKDKYYE